MLTISIVGANTTVTFTYTGLSAVVQRILAECSEALWNEEFDGKPFTQATNPEKFAKIDKDVKNYIVQIANNFKKKKAIDITIVEEASTEYVL